MVFCLDVVCLGLGGILEGREGFSFVSGRENAGYADQEVVFFAEGLDWFGVEWAEGLGRGFGRVCRGTGKRVWGGCLGGSMVVFLGAREVRRGVEEVVYGGFGLGGGKGVEEGPDWHFRVVYLSFCYLNERLLTL